MPTTDKPTSLPTSTTLLTPPQQTALTTALLSTNAIPRIQATLAHTLHEEGWSATLRAYVLQLLRSGECSTYDEVMARVLDETVNGLGERKNGGKEKVGNGDGEKAEGLRIPERAVKEGLRAVRREVDAVCEISYD